MTETKKLRGFALLSPEKRKEMASKGGKSSRAKGKGHSFSKEEAKIAVKKGAERLKEKRGKKYFAEIGKRGGLKTSSNKEHMSKIGKKGGTKVSSNREHMSKIGKLGHAAKSN